MLIQSNTHVVIDIVMLLQTFRQTCLNIVKLVLNFTAAVQILFISFWRNLDHTVNDFIEIGLDSSTMSMLIYSYVLSIS